MKGETALALADLNSALSRDPNNAGALFERGQIKKAKGDTAGAITDYDAAIRFDAGNAQAYYQRGLAREQGNDFGQAVADYKMALARDGHLTDARKALARASDSEKRNKSRLSERDKRNEKRGKKLAGNKDDRADKPQESADNTSPDADTTAVVASIPSETAAPQATSAAQQKASRNKIEKTAPQARPKKATERNLNAHGNRGVAIKIKNHENAKRAIAMRPPQGKPVRNERNASRLATRDPRRDAPKTAARRIEPSRTARHVEQRKPAARVQLRPAPVEAIRMHRAGTHEASRTDTRFTDIWNDRRR